MTPGETVDYLTNEELSQYLEMLYDNYPLVRCTTCAGHIKCLGVHDDDLKGVN